MLASSLELRNGVANLGVRNGMVHPGRFAHPVRGTLPGPSFAPSSLFRRLPGGEPSESP